MFILILFLNFLIMFINRYTMNKHVYSDFVSEFLDYVYSDYVSEYLDYVYSSLYDE